MAYHAGETVICSLEVRDSDGNLADPSTSTKITITDNRNGVEVNDQDMTNDGTGLYHYDWQTLSTSLTGIYEITYTATDGTRVSIELDKVEIIH